MLLNLNKQSWMDSLAVQNYTGCSEKNKDSMQAMLKLAKLYKKVAEAPSPRFHCSSGSMVICKH